MRVVVIGAGLAGLCSAFSLQRAGCDVTIVDRRSGPGLETSFANAGLVTPSMSQPWNVPGVHRALMKSIFRSDAPVVLRPRALLSMGAWGLAFLRESRSENYRRNTLRNFRLARYSLKVVDALYSAPPVGDVIGKTGALYLHRSPQQLELGVLEASELAREGLDFNVLSPQGCISQEPLLAPIAEKLAGGILFPDDRSGNAYRFCTRVAESFAHAGGQCRYGAQMLGWSCQNGAPRAIRTAEGDIEGDRFVLAAGSYSPALARPLGIRLPVYPVKGYSLTLAGSQLPSLPRVPVVDAYLHAAVTSLDGALRITSTAEFTGFDDGIAEARMRNLESVFSQVYPDLARRVSGPRGEVWAGFRPMCCDGVPIVGGTKVDNVFVNTGHGHLGWTLAAGSGELLAQQVTGREPAIDPADYCLGRLQ